jgi:hypothetical protein
LVEERDVDEVEKGDGVVRGKNDGEDEGVVVVKEDWILGGVVCGVPPKGCEEAPLDNRF